MKMGVMNDPSASVYEEIDRIGKAEFDFVDLTIEGPNLYFDAGRVRALLDHYHLAVIGHTDPCLPYAYPVRGIREACLKELERCARVFVDLGAQIMNIHPSYASPPRRKPDLLAMNIEALKPIAEMAGRLGITLVLENFRAPFDCVESFRRVLAESPELGVHLDFGHANMGADDGSAFCRHFPHAIKHVHFSDNRAYDDHHMPLGAGNVNWGKAVDALKTIRYDGTITLEVFCDDASVLFDYLDISRKLILKLWNR